MFAWTKPPMLPTTTAVHRCLPRTRRSRRQENGVSPRTRTTREGARWPGRVRFGHHVRSRRRGRSPTRIAPTRRRICTGSSSSGWSLRILGLGATHGSEIVHIQHRGASFIGRKLHPLGRRLQPPVGRRMQRAWLDFAAQGLGHRRNPLVQRTRLADLRHRASLHARHLLSARDMVGRGSSDSDRRKGLDRPSLSRCRGTACSYSLRRLYRNFWKNIRAITSRPSDMPSRAATPLGFIAIILGEIRSRRMLYGAPGLQRTPTVEPRCTDPDGVWVNNLSVSWPKARGRV